MPRIRLAIADDQVLFLDSLRLVIETLAPDIEIVGVAHTGIEAVELVAERRPDIILLDVRMPEMDGVEAARIISLEHPGTQIVMLTTFDDDDYVHKALAYKVVGYLLKDMPVNELIDSIRVAKEGTVLMSPSVAAKLVAELKETRSGRQRETPAGGQPSWLRELSAREKQVLRHISLGCDNREIAEKMFIAEQTVKNYVSLIYSKLGVHRRTQAMRMGQEAKLDQLRY